MSIDPNLLSPGTVTAKSTARLARLTCDLDHIAAAPMAAEFAQTPPAVDAMPGGQS